MITLTIEPGEPIAGTLTTVGQNTSTPFCGWMELIATISTLRAGQNR